MFIYTITNSVNNKIYVGLTTCSIDKRWREHKCAANTGSPKLLYRAMRMYGIDKFSIQPIYKASSIEDLREAELRFIKDLKSHAVEGGYNLTDHGHNHGAVGKVRGEEAHNSLLTEDIVRYIRDLSRVNTTNKDLVSEVGKLFGITISRDCIRDARRGDTWTHLNSICPPIKVGQGKRQIITNERIESCRSILNIHRAKAVASRIENVRLKGRSNSKLRENEVRDIFLGKESLNKTAMVYGISKKMVLLIRQRKSYRHFTQEL